jgi:hypothetical protein
MLGARPEALKRWIQTTDFRVWLLFAAQLLTAFTGFQVAVRKGPMSQFACHHENDTITLFFAIILSAFLGPFMSLQFEGELSEAEQFYMHDHLAQTLFYLCSQLFIVWRVRAVFKPPEIEGFGRLFTLFPGFFEKLPKVIELIYKVAALDDAQASLFLLWLRVTYFCREACSMSFKTVALSPDDDVVFELLKDSPNYGSDECQEHLSSMEHALNPKRKSADLIRA